MSWKRILTFSFVAVSAGALLMLYPDAACADSWLPPETATVTSQGGAYRFTIEPASMERLGEKRDKRVDKAVGILERRSDQGEWEPVWTSTLLNSIAPVSALVADDGRYVATLDNWGGVGRGNHVVVIYGEGATVIRSYRLDDLLPADYIAALSHSVSSTAWRSEAAISRSNDRLVIEVYVPSEEYAGNSSDTVTFEIVLESGEIIAPPAKEWARAQCAAKHVLERRGDTIMVGQPPRT
jgi:hypothetical protein